MKYKVKQDFLYVFDEDEPSLAYVFKKGKIFDFEQNEGSMICKQKFYSEDTKEFEVVINSEVFAECFTKMETPDSYFS